MASHGVPGKENIATDHRHAATTAASVCSIMCSQRWTFIYIPWRLAVRTIKLPHSCYYFFPCFCPQKRQQSYLAAIHSSGTQTWPTGGTENTYTAWIKWRKNLLLSSRHVSHHKSSTYKWQQLLPSTQQAKLSSKKHAKETYSNARGWVHWQCLEEGMHLCMWDDHAISSIRSQLKHRPFSERCHKPDTSPIFPFPALPHAPPGWPRLPAQLNNCFKTQDISGLKPCVIYEFENQSRSVHCQ